MPLRPATRNVIDGDVQMPLADRVVDVMSRRGVRRPIGIRIVGVVAEVGEIAFIPEPTDRTGDERFAIRGDVTARHVGPLPVRASRVMASAKLHVGNLT